MIILGLSPTAHESAVGLLVDGRIVAAASEERFTRVKNQGGFPLRALEFCLKCSHLFNILDSSNSIGVTERTAYILRVRQLALQIAKAYVGEPAGKATA